MMDPDILGWLLELENPSARYLALTQLLDRPQTDPEAASARAAILDWGPARAILDAQWPEGYWVHPGVGYSPKHRATVWQIIFLAALGAPCTGPVERACGYVLANSRLGDGRFSAYKTAQGAIACLNGNLLAAMQHLGYHDARLDESLEALASMVERDGFRCRFNAPSPLPARMHDGLPCAWGAVKMLGAFGAIPAEERTEPVRDAIAAGVEFLFGTDLAGGTYPTATTPSPLWHQFGFPLGYTSDLLEILLVLGQLGLARDARLGEAIGVLISKRLPSGKWSLQHTPKSTWGTFGRLGTPSKWITLRALRVLRDWEGTP
ncbi:nitrogen fixation protein NifH [Chloroflexota bacterium]